MTFINFNNFNILSNAPGRIESTELNNVSNQEIFWIDRNESKEKIEITSKSIDATLDEVGNRIERLNQKLANIFGDSTISTIVSNEEGESNTKAITDIEEENIPDIFDIQKTDENYSMIEEDRYDIATTVTIEEAIESDATIM